MTKSEYLTLLDQQDIDLTMVETLENQYGCEFPSIVARVISSAKESVFFDDDGRILSFEEMVDANTDLHVDFTGQGLLPIADWGENNFVVFHTRDKRFSLFNIVDECSFREKEKLADILK
jgi:hypothetical protein